MDQNIFRQNKFGKEKELNKTSSRINETYAKLELPHGEHGKKIIYVKGSWYPTHFIMFVLDGQDTWNLNGISNTIYYYYD